MINGNLYFGASYLIQTFVNKINTKLWNDCRGCSKISKISKKSLCKTTPFSLTLQACKSEFLNSTKSGSKKNVYCDCSLK